MMPSLKKYFAWLKKCLLLPSKNCGSALTTFLENRREEPIYEEISSADGQLHDETLNTDYEKPITVEEPIYEEIRHPEESIYMDMEISSATLKSNRNEPTHEQDLRAKGEIDRERVGAQTIQMSNDNSSEILHALLQLMTMIALPREKPESHYVDMREKQSTQASTRIDIVITITLNHPPAFVLTCR
jgi:hypothetical protein